MSRGNRISLSALAYSLCWLGLACTQAPQRFETGIYDGRPSPRLDVA